MPPPKMSIEEAYDNRRIIQESKRTRYLLQKNIVDDNRVVIYASKAPSKCNIDMRYAFKVEIVRDPKENAKYIQCFSLSLEDDSEAMLWHLNIGRSIDFHRFAEERFAQYLQQYHTRSMEAREIREYIRKTTFNEEKVFKTFEKVEVDTCVREVIANVSPMKVITMRGDDSQSPVPASQWETSPGYCYAPFTAINYGQILNLRTSKICVSIERLTARNIAMFIELWKNGDIGDDLEFVIWKDYDGEFDIGELGALMKANLEQGQLVWIQHSKNANRIGRLYRKEGEIRFFVDALDEPIARIFSRL